MNQIMRVVHGQSGGFVDERGQKMGDDRESREQRAVRYRKMAEEAQEFAAESRFPETRAEYLSLVKAWRMLAKSVERSS